jgi:hypothetical protein
MSNRELSLANEIAHGGTVGYTLSFYCENCKARYFQILHAEEKIGNRHEDIIIEKKYYLKCQECGSEQAENVITIVPSWSGPRIDRDKLPVWRKGWEEQR